MQTTFEITRDRAFLKHFLTRFRVISLSAQMVEKLKAASGTDLYAAYGYGRWLSCVNPEKDSLDQAENLLMRAAQEVPDAKAALAEMHYAGRVASGKANPDMYAFLMLEKAGEWSELRQVIGLENGIFGEHGIPKNPALIADILRGQIDKHPDVDTLYYELLGWALADDEPAAAEEAFRTVIGRGDMAGYYCLANLLREQGREDEANDVAEEGARKGDFRCRRLWAVMEQEDYEKLPPERQETLHKALAEGMDYAISHHDRFACYLKGMVYYLGILGFDEDLVKALEPLQRGAEMGDGRCAWLLAAIQESGELPAELQMKSSETAFLHLQAARMGEDNYDNLLEVAKAYVCHLLPEQEEELEKYHLKTFMDKALEKDEDPDATGILSVYPEGFYYAWDADEELDLEAFAEKMDARGFDIVHFSPLLSRLTKALDLEHCHVAMLVDKDGYAKDLPDNMTGTMVYGQGAEMRGPVAFVLETDKGYELLPLKGLQRIYLLIELLKAATGGLLRQPTSEEAERIGVEIDGGFEEYDDFEEKFDDPDIYDGYEPEREVEEDMVSADTSDDAAPQERTVSIENVMEGIAQCNLCRDTLVVTYPDDRKYWFMSIEELLSEWRLKDAVEENIQRHGGYMIDEWNFVDSRQVPMDIRSRIRFCPDR